MPMTTTIAAARLSREVPAAEARLDDALVALSNLMSTMVVARRDTGVAAATGQAALVRLAKAQMTLIEAQSDVLRVHGELVKVGRETGAHDLNQDCKELLHIADAEGDRIAA
jgi:hypothetical protein